VRVGFGIVVGVSAGCGVLVGGVGVDKTVAAVTYGD